MFFLDKANRLNQLARKYDKSAKHSPIEENQALIDCYAFMTGTAIEYPDDADEFERREIDKQYKLQHEYHTNISISLEFYEYNFNNHWFPLKFHLQVSEEFSIRLQHHYFYLIIKSPEKARAWRQDFLAINDHQYDQENKFYAITSSADCILTPLRARKKTQVNQARENYLLCNLEAMHTHLKLPNDRFPPSLADTAPWIRQKRKGLFRRRQTPFYRYGIDRRSK